MWFCSIKGRFWNILPRSDLLQLEVSCFTLIHHFLFLTNTVCLFGSSWIFIIKRMLLKIFNKKNILPDKHLKLVLHSRSTRRLHPRLAINLHSHLFFDFYGYIFSLRQPLSATDSSENFEHVRNGETNDFESSIREFARFPFSAASPKFLTSAVEIV